MAGHQFSFRVVGCVSSFVWNNDPVKKQEQYHTFTEQRLAERGHVERMIQANIRSFDLQLFMVYGNCE